MPLVLQVDLRNLGFNLALEFIGRPLELIERLADLPPDFWQLLGPKDDQSHKENEDHLWKTQIHPLIINAEGHWQQCKATPGTQRDSVLCVTSCPEPALSGVEGWSMNLTPARDQTFVQCLETNIEASCAQGAS